MARILLVLALLALTIYAVADWAARSRSWTPGRVNRWVWLAVILLIPAIGPLAWIITGWVTRAEQAREPRVSREESPERRPDDNPEAISDLADRIARREKRTKPPRRTSRADSGDNDEPEDDSPSDPLSTRDSDGTDPDSTGEGGSSTGGSPRL